MKTLANIYDFVAGGSIVAPIGLALAVAAAYFGGALQPSLRAAVFLGILVLTFFASTLERAR
jgi:hypothetical protein